MSFFLTVLSAIVVADLLWWWRADHFLRPLPRAPLWRWLLGVFMGGQLLLIVWIIFARALDPDLQSATPTVLTALAYVWHLLALPAVVVVWAFAGFAIGTWRLGRWSLGWIGRDRRSDAEATAADPLAPALGPLPGPPATPSRRQFLGAVAAAAPPALTGIAVGASLPRLDDFRVRPITVNLPSLPPELDGLRIAHVSDMHVGRFTTGRALRRIVEATNRLDADVILLTGDLINNALVDLSDGIAAVQNMQSRHGSYLCVGNHDLIEDGRAFVSRTKTRLPLLVNESHTVTHNGYPLQLLGLPWTRREAAIGEAMRGLLPQVRPGAFPILLAHHPHAFDPAAEAGIPLTLAGHTHGGQLMLSESVGFGPLMYRYWSGLYRKASPDGASLVVSNGVGNWFPLRTNAPAEIIDLTLRRPG